MATRWFLASPTADGYIGRHVQQDGYPDTAVPILMQLVLAVHGGDVQAARHHLITEHPDGWLNVPDAHGAGQCFCHDIKVFRSSNFDGTEDKVANPQQHQWLYVMHATHLAVFASDGEQFTHAADHPWGPENTDRVTGAAKNWRVIYNPSTTTPLLLLGAFPSGEDAELDEELGSYTTANSLSSVTVESRTLTDALRQARALIDHS
ncbi:hypothetical protein E6W39_29330 [Kitasatospora acidiphila]|uniref:Uncharacterized protein n=1 Tax=Kitasatospora acidiphila TaxID=2567942 RepID=A0A540W9J0_9ACTN|nr:hypothetical protein [Kitasatospora acidiphila]TQF05587.1 hypothetical protein E6W39_29330 [Kitasatospora acidiphila]